MNEYNKITALYSRLSVGDEDRDGGESNSIQNQKIKGISGTVRPTAEINQYPALH